MALNLKLETFEGPLDLLFHLIEKAKVDIYDIPIFNITQQYIEYIDQMKKFDLEITSEFLVMASTLMEIKSKMLLPNKKETQLELDLEEDPRQELILKLVEYKKFKEAALSLKDRQNLYKKIFYKEQEQIDEYIIKDVYDPLDLELCILKEAFQNILKRKKKEESINIDIQILKREEITIEDKLKYIRGKLQSRAQIEFEELFSDFYTKTELVVTFLAILELIKLKVIRVKQDKAFEKIHLRKVSKEV
ncbi:MAG: segregation/condensation protein A [Anaeromicrobium sp.]|jgi:segregation and condensation protein A|uniref:segregation and condensation protein A n=1 Tax=Anaeromicrobium sp. TaxID=1929132 RepID=UPI0025E81CB1|nr:segregation/condensation protein A [Anaeromicrobium sp.]MCT4594687.1 segregation/condensation protein A [Anaeromicrobium sp.]